MGASAIEGKAAASIQSPKVTPKKEQQAAVARAEAEPKDTVELSRQAQLSQNRTEGQGPGWKRSDDKVQLDEQQTRVLDEMGEEYTRSTDGQELRVTSGKRTPEQTSKQLYDDIRDGKADSLYGDKPEYQELKQIYQSSNDEEAVRQQMLEKVQQQESEGRYLSNHQVSKSFDISTRGMTADEIETARRIATEKGLTVKDEGDHLHMDFPDAPVETSPNSPEDITRQEQEDRDYNSTYRGQWHNWWNGYRKW
ncbi:MAG: hypothetical protein AMXMBFR33_29500 [Candidatus Xenobia bacterium]|jgi:hypothetical protein